MCICHCHHLGTVDSMCHQLSENIRLVWSKRSYSGENVGCHACARRTEFRENININIQGPNFFDPSLTPIFANLAMPEAYASSKLLQTRCTGSLLLYGVNIKEVMAIL